jgi:hypothetical protein
MSENVGARWLTLFMANQHTSSGDAGDHPVVRFAASLDAAIDKVSGFAPTFMSTAQKRAALVALERQEQRLYALKLRVLACAHDVAEEAAAKDVGAWLASESRLARHHTARDLKLAAALDERWTALGDAVADGAVNADQAQVIVRALDRLPDDLEPEQVTKAEEHLIGEAAHFGPAELARLGEHLLEVIAPDTYEALIAQQLAREERRAREGTALRVKPLGEGLCRVTATLSEAAANRLLTTLDAYTSPRHRQGDRDDNAPGAPADGKYLSLAKQRGQAFCTLLEHLDPTKLPAHGGDATSLVITMSLEQLRKELGAGAVIGHDTHRLSAGEVRRLACTAKLIPAVLGTHSETLDLGRSARLFSRAQVKALRLRDQGCRADGCTVPVTWTEAHHLDPWSRGGRTDLANGLLLCNWHHHRIHDDRYRHERLPNGDIRFARRTEPHRRSASRAI